MKRAIIELNEVLRMQKVKDYAVLDTEPEELFDNITKLASSITNCPVSMISIMDEKRLWFKSKVGLNSPEISREDSLCKNVIMQSEILEIPDASKDPRFSKNVFVTGDFHLRFYAGVPLTTPDGFNLGTLCVIDTQAKTLSSTQKEQLVALSNVAVNLLEMRRVNLRLANLEVQAAESEKLATMGVFASGISHEINNPLSIIMTSVEILKYEVENNSPDKEGCLKLCSAIFETAGRIAKIVKALKILSHKNEKENFHPVLAKDAFTTVLAVTENKIKKSKIDYSYNIPQNFQIHACEVGVAQILTNLIHNAYDAIVGSENPWIKVETECTENNITFKVINSGSKIKQEVVERMFLPFFTTKEIGKGTGLGLSISRNIAQDFNGSLEYDFAADNTTFILQVPGSICTQGSEKKIA